LPKFIAAQLAEIMKIRKIGRSSQGQLASLNSRGMATGLFTLGLYQALPN